MKPKKQMILIEPFRTKIIYKQKEEFYNQMIDHEKILENGWCKGVDETKHPNLENVVRRFKGRRKKETKVP